MSENPTKYYLEAQGTYLKGKKAFIIHVPRPLIESLEGASDAQTVARSLALIVGIDASVPILLAGSDSSGQWRVLGTPELIDESLEFLKKNPFPVEFSVPDTQNPLL